MSDRIKTDAWMTVKSGIDRQRHYIIRDFSTLCGRNDIFGGLLTMDKPIVDLCKECNRIFTKIRGE